MGLTGYGCFVCIQDPLGAKNRRHGVTVMPNDLPWRKAIERVLREAGTAMHYKDIAAQVVADGLRKSVGATPASTVAVCLSNSINKDGGESPFQKVGRGEYVLRKSARAARGPKAAPETPEHDEASEEQYAIISSFGMFWRRDLVDWSAKANILGMQQIGAEAVIFREQLGIYLLYDGREIIYVGRATDRPIGRRLYEHTQDRLSTRWDRFSWFGVLPVSDKGMLGPLPEIYDSRRILPALEAILIEALEPRQNRKRGDDLSAVEYLQKEDPKVEQKKKKAILEAALQQV